MNEKFQNYMQSHVPKGADYFIDQYRDNATPLPYIEGLEDAVNIVNGNLANTEITVYTDYDTDGILSGGIITKLLLFVMDNMRNVTDQTPSTVRLVIPDRITDGYGFNVAQAASMRNGLIILTDNGITSNDAILTAKANNNTVIVLDHHLGDKSTCPADAVVDPNAESPQTSQFCEYCAAGLAYRFARAYLDQDWVKEACDQEQITNALDEFLFLAAIATVSDCVPVINENRVIIIEGLTHIPSYWEGAMREICEIQDSCMITEETISYKVSPTLNAPGRMRTLTNEEVYRFILDGEEERCRIALKFKEDNNKRKEATDQGLLIAMHSMDAGKPMFVLQDDRIYQGVTGIIAGILRDQYNKPGFVFGKAQNGTIVGSGRSDDVNLKDMLDYVNQADPSILVRYGGHKNAAGCTIRKDAFGRFSKLCCDYYEQHKPETTEANTLYELDENENWGEIYDIMRAYAPFGTGNPAPVLRCTIQPISGISPTMGQGGQDVRLNDKFGHKVVGFKKAYLLDPTACKYIVTGTLNANNYHGGAEMQFVASDIQPVCNAD